MTWGHVGVGCGLVQKSLSHLGVEGVNQNSRGGADAGAATLHGTTRVGGPQKVPQ